MKGDFDYDKKYIWKMLLYGINTLSSDVDMSIMFHACIRNIFFVINQLIINNIKLCGLETHSFV